MAVINPQEKKMAKRTSVHCTKMGANISVKKTQMPQNLSAQFVCPSPKVLDFNEKRLHWASVVRAFTQGEADPNYFRSVFTSFSRRYSANTEY
jgi:hypothetical protein